MDIYIRCDRTADGRNQVVFTHYFPLDPVHGMGLTRAELEKTGFFIPSMPEADAPAGQEVAAIFYDPTSGTISYEYKARPLTDSERIAKLEQELAELKTLLQQNAPLA